MKLLLIGAGGVCSYLMPALLNTFRKEIHEVVIYDKDIVEQRNLERQLFDIGDVGGSKASALRNKYGALLEKNCKMTVVADWFNADRDYALGPDDWILCMADNHRARRDAVQIAQQANCGVILGGNELTMAHVMVWHPILDEKFLPTRRFDLSSNEGSPFRCNTAEALEIHPQLAMANILCSSLMLQALWSWTREGRDTIKDYLPIDYSTSDTKFRVTSCNN